MLTSEVKDLSETFKSRSKIIMSDKKIELSKASFIETKDANDVLVVLF